MPQPDTPSGPAICIVTPGYISQTPRVVREADALAAAGYDVRVVFTQGPLHSLREFDRELLAMKPWRWSARGWSNTAAAERWTFHRSRIRHRLTRAIARALPAMAGVAERAEGRIYPELAALAAAAPADLYIGHYPTGLAAASFAARRRGGMVGYDLEDLYADTLAPGEQSAESRARILTIEQRYASRCEHISAVSQPVAEVFAERHRCSTPIVVHNCYPWADRQQIDGRMLQRRGPHLSLYWFSQTVGLNRGLQDAIRAAGLLSDAVQIHVQGGASPDVKEALKSLAVECRVGDRLHFHPQVPPAELLSRAAEHDVGLALETEESLNRRLAVTNKMFLYFIAGLAVAASDLPGQRSVLARCPSAGAMYKPGDFRKLAADLQKWARDPGLLTRTRDASLTAGWNCWNWERESRDLVEAIDGRLRAPSKARRHA